VNRTPSSERREQLNQEFFNDWAKKYDGFRISRWFQYTQELALGQFGLHPDGSLLDVGCGTGSALLMAAERLPRGRVCGVDVSTAMVTQARAKIPVELSDQVEIRQGGAEHLPFKAGEFDYVLCTNSFHHYHDPKRALAEMRRVLRPGGELVIFENAPDLSLYTWVWDRFLRIYEKGHVRYYPSQELGGIIRNAGFEDVQLRVLRNEKFKYGKLFASIQIWAAREPAIEGATV
jgi:ubiquinone/menaquinone biosynthesis C-methylase UbiE